MKNILIILFSLSIVACQSPIEKKEKTLAKGGEYIKQIYFDNGNLKSEISLKNKKKNGLAINYYETGKVHLKVTYKDNIKEGKSIWFYENGQKYRENNYVDNLKNGIEKYYYDNGLIQSEQTFLNGIIGDDLKEYTKQGILKKKYPKLILNQKVDYNNNAILIGAKLDNNKKAIFHREIKDESYSNPGWADKINTKHKSKVFKRFFYPTEIVFEKTKVSAAFKTRNGRIKIISKTINISAN